MIPAPSRTRLAHGQLTWRESGPKDAPALVLLHGIGSTSPRWEHQFAALGGAQGPFRVVAWNAPGYRDSDPLPAATPSAEDYARALASLLDAIGVEQAWVASNSWGTLIALAYAKLYPQRVRGLVLGGPTAGYGTLPAAEGAAAAEKRIARITTLGPEKMVEQDAANLVSPKAEAALIAKLQAGGSELTVEGYAQAARMLYSTDGIAMIAALAQPVLILSGEDDRITPPETNARRLLAAARNGAIEMLPGVGHLPHLEAPRRFNDAVLEFIRKHG